MKTFDRARNQSCATAPAQPLSYKKIICGETAIKIVKTGMGHSDSVILKLVLRLLVHLQVRFLFFEIVP